MGRAWGIYGDMRGEYRGLVVGEDTRWKETFEAIDVDGRVILNLIFK